MIQIEKDAAYSLFAQSQANDIVCPSHLCKGLFIVGAMDNIDHDQSFTTAQSSFCGTAKKLQYFFDEYKLFTWASRHAHLQPPMTEPPSISAMLPFFTHKADSPAMIKHAMDTLQSMTIFLHQSWHVTVPSLPKQSSFNGHGQPRMEKMYSL